MFLKASIRSWMSTYSGDKDYPFSVERVAAFSLRNPLDGGTLSFQTLCLCVSLSLA